MGSPGGEDGPGYQHKERWPSSKLTRKVRDTHRKNVPIASQAWVYNYIGTADTGSFSLYAAVGQEQADGGRSSDTLATARQ